MTTPPCPSPRFTLLEPARLRRRARAAGQHENLSELVQELIAELEAIRDGLLRSDV